MYTATYPMNRVSLSHIYSFSSSSSSSLSHAHSHAISHVSIFVLFGVQLNGKEGMRSGVHAPWGVVVWGGKGVIRLLNGVVGGGGD